MPQFEQYLGIDYSGAQTPTSSLKGLRLYAATPTQPPAEIEPPPSPRKYWTRRGLAEYLAERLAEGQPTVVGIDHPKKSSRSPSRAVSSPRPGTRGGEIPAMPGPVMPGAGAIPGR